MARGKRETAGGTVELGSLKPGQEFKHAGKEYRLVSLGKKAEVMLLKHDKVNAGEGRTKDIAYGVSRETLPRGTKVEV